MCATLEILYVVLLQHLKYLLFSAKAQSNVLVGLGLTFCGQISKFSKWNLKGRVIDIFNYEERETYLFLVCHSCIFILWFLEKTPSFKSVRLQKLLDQSVLAYWALLDHTGPYWLLLGPSEFFWVLLRAFFAFAD